MVSLAAGSGYEVYAFLETDVIGIHIQRQAILQSRRAFVHPVLLTISFCVCHEDS
jgi:hypothetical protein